MIILTGRLHAAIVGLTGRLDNRDDRSDEAFTRSDRRPDPRYVKPVGPTGRTDCSRTGHICQSNQCSLPAEWPPIFVVDGRKLNM